MPQEPSTFQSTHPLGVRLNTFIILPFPSYVSIHAPTRGATLHRERQFRQFLSFNPRTHSGCDARCNCLVCRGKCFNPRTHSGCDFLVHQLLHDILNVSIHAPTRGATISASTFAAPPVFQSTHPLGVRPKGDVLSQCGNSFNPRTHSGCDFFLFRRK